MVGGRWRERFRRARDRLLCRRDQAVPASQPGPSTPPPEQASSAHLLGPQTPPREQASVSRSESRTSAQRQASLSRPGTSESSKPGSNKLRKGRPYHSLSSLHPGQALRSNTPLDVPLPPLVPVGPASGRSAASSDQSAKALGKQPVHDHPLRANPVMGPVDGSGNLMLGQGPSMEIPAQSGSDPTGPNNTPSCSHGSSSDSLAAQAEFRANSPLPAFLMAPSAASYQESSAGADATQSSPSPSRTPRSAQVRLSRLRISAVPPPSPARQSEGEAEAEKAETEEGGRAPSESDDRGSAARSSPAHGSSSPGTHPSIPRDGSPQGSGDSPASPRRYRRYRQRGDGSDSSSSGSDYSSARPRLECEI
ncbi:hypothetical protein VTK26DRAFT_980 [Humicola hyalothermophila]